MRDALGIVMRAPLVFLPAGSSPKERPDHIVSDEEKDSILSPGNFLWMTDPATCGPATRLDCIRGSRDHENLFVYHFYLPSFRFSSKDRILVRKGARGDKKVSPLFSQVRFCIFVTLVMFDFVMQVKGER
jgi:hypothetical protein